MKIYSNVDEVLRDIDNLEWPGVLFVDRKKWEKNSLTAQILFLIDDDELEDIIDINTHLPKLAYERSMSYLLDIEMFKAIIDNQRENNKCSSVDDYVYAVNYYLEYDNFYTP